MALPASPAKLINGTIMILLCLRYGQSTAGEVGGKQTLQLGFEGRVARIVLKVDQLEGGHQ
ncbi:hypothetical protein FACS1894159_04110 [Bacteroidia bacterium]|nr:hypothetical protein FACS1894159_04110 [Bacteroidia bacterium]